MHVQFEFNQDDLVDASKRYVGRSKIVRSFQLKNLLATAFLTWLLIFLILYRTPVRAAILGLAAALLSAALYPVVGRREIERRLRKIVKEMFGDKKSFLCEVELRPDGVWVRQMDRQILLEWPSVAEIRDTADSVDIVPRDGSGVVVRNRAFSSPEQRLKFIELARAGIASANDSSTSEKQNV
ncbi:MAG TPA: hypothetical protein VGN90_13400 [Pyrinomonadaceae bacterium]|jgi:hypothetical protein|nr:hypothetical protein [Pyrinomonadaceae bacterium]